jgi:hypothetical protein
MWTISLGSLRPYSQIFDLREKIVSKDERSSLFWSAVEKMFDINNFQRVSSQSIVEKRKLGGEKTGGRPNKKVS